MTHGTVSGYVHHKCRCQKCKTAWAQYLVPRTKARRKAMRAKTKKRR